MISELSSTFHKFKGMFHFVNRFQKLNETKDVASKKKISSDEFESKMKKITENQRIKNMFKIEPESGTIKSHKPAKLTISFLPTIAVDFKSIPVFKCIFMDPIKKEPNHEPYLLHISGRIYFSS